MNNASSGQSGAGIQLQFSVKKAVSFFLYTAGALFMMTATAKFISSLGDQQVLQSLEPVFRLPFRHMFIIAGSLELSVGLLCLFSDQVLLRATLAALLSTCLLVYRLKLIWMGYHMPCSCLGSLTDALHIPAQTADTTAKIILAYLLTGSYACLLWLGWSRKKYS